MKKIVLLVGVVSIGLLVGTPALGVERSESWSPQVFGSYRVPGVSVSWSSWGMWAWSDAWAVSTTTYERADGGGGAGGWHNIHYRNWNPGEARYVWGSFPLETQASAQWYGIWGDAFASATASAHCGVVYGYVIELILLDETRSAYASDPGVGAVSSIETVGNGGVFSGFDEFVNSVYAESTVRTLHGQSNGYASVFGNSYAE